MRNLKTIVFFTVLVFLAKVFIGDQLVDGEKKETNLTRSRIPASTINDRP